MNLMQQYLSSIAKCHRPAAASASERNSVVAIEVKLGEKPVEEDWNKSL